MTEILIQEESQYLDFIQKLKSSKIVVVDTESTGLDVYATAKITGVSVYLPSSSTGVYLPFRHGDGNLPIEYLERFKKDWNESIKGKKLVGFNLMFDAPIMMLEGFDYPDDIEDVLIIARAVNENEVLSNSFNKETGDFKFTPKGAYRLKRLSAKYLGEDSLAGEQELEKYAQEAGVDAKTEMWKLPAHAVSKYAIYDVVLTWNLRQYYQRLIQAWGLTEYLERQFYLQRNYFIRSAMCGFKVDLVELKRQSEEITRELEEIQQWFNEYVTSKNLPFETPLHLTSHQKMLEFFQYLGYDVTKTNSLERNPYVRSGEEVWVKYDQFKHLSKEMDSYYTTYARHVDSNGYLHPGWQQIGAVSGRPTCSEPNMLQINKNGAIKKSLVPTEGYVLVSIDYKQVELRLAAHFSQEEQMVRWFLDDLDPHQQTADSLTQLLGYVVPRSEGKRLNFGLLYGMGYKKYSESYGVPEDESKKLVDAWRKTYPKCRQLMFQVQELGDTHRELPGSSSKGYYITVPVSGKIRRYDGTKIIRKIREQKKNYDVMPGETYEKYGRKMVAKEPLVLSPYDESYTAFNTIIQGSATGIMERSLIQMVREFPDNSVLRPIISVYDSNVFEVREDMLDTVVSRVKEIMEDYVNFAVPITVDVEISKKSYGELETWKPQLDSSE